MIRLAFEKGIAFDSGPVAWQGSRRSSPFFSQRSDPLANSELGAKQICPHCQAKFYDLGRRPAVCPKCGTQFDPEEAVRNRRIRARTATPDYDADDEKPAKVVDKDVEGFEDEPDETPEIDEAVEADPVDADEDTDADATPPSPVEDLGVDFAEEDVEEAEDDTVPFLEDEDDDFVDEEIEGIPGDEDSER
jgi:uncharacterized protein (TIGR02300 family)